MDLDGRSNKKLDEVHPDLARVIRRAAAMCGVFGGTAETGITFVVTEGRRASERQLELVRAGASKTTKSRHVAECNGCGLPCACDLAVRVNGEIRWDWPLYADLAKLVKAAAMVEKVPIEWGGDWASLKDGPHYQLPWKEYP